VRYSRQIKETYPENVLLKSELKKEYLKITLFNATTSSLFGLSCVSHENDAGMYNEIISILTIFSRFSAPELAQGGDCGAVLEAHFHVLFARHCYS